MSVEGYSGKTAKTARQNSENGTEDNLTYAASGKPVEQFPPRSHIEDFNDGHHKYDKETDGDCLLQGIENDIDHVNLG